MGDATQIISIIGGSLGIIASIYVIVEKIFGGGNALASKFAKLETDTIERVRNTETRLQMQQDDRAKNLTIGIDAISSNIHRMELAFLTQRAEVAENYLSRKEYYKTIDELKTDVKDANRETREEMRKLFSHLDERLMSVQQSIDHTRRVPVNA